MGAVTGGIRSCITAAANAQLHLSRNDEATVWGWESHRGDTGRSWRSVTVGPCASVEDDGTGSSSARVRRRRQLGES